MGYNEQPDYSLVVLIILLATILGTVILYCVVKIAVRNGVNESNLSKKFSPEEPDLQKTETITHEDKPDTTQTNIDKDGSEAILSPWA